MRNRFRDGLGCSLPRWGECMLEGLMGDWLFERQIDGHGSMSGDASFTLTESGAALYREAGVLRLDSGESLPARQSYLYEAVAGGFAVRFVESGELFHRVLLVQDGDVLRGEAEHLCGADLYASTYEIGGDGFAVRHRVKGSRKDYVMRTVYQRA